MTDERLLKAVPQVYYEGKELKEYGRPMRYETAPYPASSGNEGVIRISREWEGQFTLYYEELPQFIAELQDLQKILGVEDATK